MSNSKFENSTFKGEEPTWANACVGENGNPQIIEYANGFAAAANLLIDQVINDESKTLYVDEFIYPICFNMRHALELHLKAAIEKITAIAELRRFRLPEILIASTHDLGNLWKYVKSNADLLDKRYNSTLTKLDEYVNDIAEVDSTGQVFRYPFDTENRKHLVDVSIINVIVLKHRFNKLETLLSKLNELNEHLINEYACGSFTTKLSRPELFDIASKLPKRSQWGEAEFDIVKADLRKQYGLTSNDFCRALKVIQDHYEMSQHIDAVPPLAALTDNMLHVFFDQWVKLHDIDKKNRMEADSDSGSEWETVVRNRSKEREALEQWWSESGGLFSASPMAELNAIYYFPTGLPYSEHFILSRGKFNEKAAVYGQGGLKNDVFHLLRKTNAMSEILSSLLFLGQGNLVKSLVERYGLNDAPIRNLG